MLQTCSECQRSYDDLDHWTFCPHEKLAANPMAVSYDTRREMARLRYAREASTGYLLESLLGFEHLPTPPPLRTYGHLVRVSATDLRGNRDEAPIFTQINGVGGKIPRERQVALLPQFLNVLRDSSQQVRHFGEVLMDYEGNVYDFLHSVRWQSTGLEFEPAVIWCARLKEALDIPRGQR